MSMETLTIFQLVGIFCAYLFVSVGLPAFVLGGKLKGHRAPERLIIYFMIGNFYMMNLVFALQLLKISCQATLILGTLLPAVVVRIVIYRIPIFKIIVDEVHYLQKLTGGQLGVKTAVYKVGGIVRRQVARFFRWVGYYLFRRFFDCVLTAVLLAALWWLYGNNLLEQFGYKASDVLVHNYWINALSHNRIFVAGVYPHGFHAVIYYLHAVFGIETFVLLRIFAFVQNVMMHLMILCCLRMCCKTKYAAYIGSFIYLVGDYLGANAYFRFYATLPQEFSVTFILPTIYFGFRYFEVRRQKLLSGAETELSRGKTKAHRRRKKKEPQEELADTQPSVVSLADISLEEIDLDESGVKGAGENVSKRRKRLSHGKGRDQKRELPKGKRQEKHYPASWLYLAGFAISFAMTLAIHFYSTMIVGIFCIAIAIGYRFLLFQRPYFKNVMAAGLLGVGLAVLPMLLAFIGGTPLEGSLLWGMSIIKGTGTEGDAKIDNRSEDDEQDSSQETEETKDVEEPVEDETFTVMYDGEEITVYQGIDMNEEAPEEVLEEEPKEQISLGERLRRLPENVAGFVYTAVTETQQMLNSEVFAMENENDVYWIMFSFVGLIGIGLLYRLFRQPCYGAMFTSVGLYMLFMCILIAAKTFHLPALMSSDRCSIYFAYSMPVVLAFLVDGVLYLPFFSLRKRPAKIGRVIMNLLSFVCVVCVVYYMVERDRIKKPLDIHAQETNEAVTCLTNIIRSEADYTWTIVSANDELRMGEDHGYHYETIAFLITMEGASPNAFIRIPTKVVYFFIEKVPLDYYLPYENSGQSISREGALRELPYTVSSSAYAGERRWIVMSRMYYWAENFRSLYPDEMEIYMETDNFVCYRIEQNPYRLYNFAINYGFNTYVNDEE
ncbi:MAG: hypothetical protein NC417_04715 [Candidatus Gastranaerophilales bacterium]|nr:hypothetical protein [Candidatus Gastranaerophilales bacterium]